MLTISGVRMGQLLGRRDWQGGGMRRGRGLDGPTAPEWGGGEAGSEWMPRRNDMYLYGYAVSWL